VRGWTAPVRSLGLPQARTPTAVPLRMRGAPLTLVTSGSRTGGSAVAACVAAAAGSVAGRAGGAAGRGGAGGGGAAVGTVGPAAAPAAKSC